MYYFPIVAGGGFAFPTATGSFGGLHQTLGMPVRHHHQAMVRMGCIGGPLGPSSERYAIMGSYPVMGGLLGDAWDWTKGAVEDVVSTGKDAVGKTLQLPGAMLGWTEAQLNKLLPEDLKPFAGLLSSPLKVQGQALTFTGRTIVKGKLANPKAALRALIQQAAADAIKAGRIAMENPAIRRLALATAATILTVPTGGTSWAGAVAADQALQEAMKDPRLKKVVDEVLRNFDVSARVDKVAAEAKAKLGAVASARIKGAPMPVVKTAATATGLAGLSKQIQAATAKAQAALQPTSSSQSASAAARAAAASAAARVAAAAKAKAAAAAKAKAKAVKAAPVKAPPKVLATIKGVPLIAHPLSGAQLLPNGAAPMALAKKVFKVGETVVINKLPWSWTGMVFARAVPSSSAVTAAQAAIAQPLLITTDARILKGRFRAGRMLSGLLVRPGSAIQKGTFDAV